jgi:maltokinase
MTTAPLHMTPEQLHDFLTRARWFGGKGRRFKVAENRSIPLSDSTWIELVEVTYENGDSECYQLPLVAYDWPQDRLAHALVEFVDDMAVYDAVHDREAMSAWLGAFADEADFDKLHFNRVPGSTLDTDNHSTLFQGEQSNSSVAFGEDAQLKVFRRITPGNNPDIEIHEALTRVDGEHIARLVGWLSLDDDDEVMHLAMLQEYIRTATDGWEVALASVRDLLAEADLHADEVGGDFAGEAHRLGAVVCEIHQTLREQLGDTQIDVAEIADGMLARLDEAIGALPQLADYAPSLREYYERVRQSDQPVTVQRIHGDLHLGQTLRDTMGWKIVDFEGEPAKPLAARQLPDSPWRDVAGMLRSFDYAARAGADDVHVMGDAGSQAQYRATEWRARNQEAFLAGYFEQLGRDLTDQEDILLQAYAADKTVYEAVYEARNRPDWLHIPLEALDRIKAGQIREQLP